MKGKQKKRIVVVGGGTGTYTILKGLKKYVQEIEITAIVTMADSGGSTGRLRDEFGYLPVGDVRMALAALAREQTEHHELLRQLFLYRFQKGVGLQGHNFGNIFLTALRDIVGSEVEAIAVASELLRVSGKVIPVTISSTQLRARYDTGVVIVGEHNIDEQSICVGERIEDVSVVPNVSLNRDAEKAIVEADFILFGPGDLYTSIIANCVIDRFSEALSASQGKVLFVMNLMSKHCQTTGMHASAHVEELSKYTKRVPDVVIVHTNHIDTALIERYAEKGEHLIRDDFVSNGPFEVVREHIVGETVVSKDIHDAVRRSFIRHDSDRLAKVVMRYLRRGKVC